MSPKKKLPPQVVIVGSHAPGLFMRVHRAPGPGETVIGWEFQEPMDGGKGSNQAIAAAKLGLRSSFVGCVGKDRLAEDAKKWMSDAGVDLDHLYYSQSKNTGVGFILLDDDGIPAMVTSMGANEDLDKKLVEKALSDLSDAQVMLTQFEIQPEVALHAVRIAHQLGMLTIINPAPAVNICAAELSIADIVIPNEIEAKLLLGYESDEERDPVLLVQELLKKSHVGCVLITLGEKGIIGADGSGVWRVVPPPVQVVDTSGAGDVFCAALATSIVNGLNFRMASKWACKAATLSVTKAGTIPSYPSFEEVEVFICSL